MGSRARLPVELLTPLRKALRCTNLKGTAHLTRVVEGNPHTVNPLPYSNDHVFIVESFMSGTPRKRLRLAAVALAAIAAAAPALLYNVDLFSSKREVLALTQNSGKDDLVAAESQQRMIIICARLTGDDQVECLKNTVLSSLVSRTYYHTRVALDRADLNNPSFWLNCHQAMHAIGGTVLELYRHQPDGVVDRPTAASLALTDIDSPTCGGALVHGVLETVSINSYKSAEWQPIMDACVEVMKQTPTEAFGCAHGIGHGLVDSAGREITNYAGETLEQRVALHREGMLSDIIKRCEQLAPAGTKAGEDCAYGTAMQIYDLFAPNKLAIDDPQNLIAGCEGLRPDVHKGCSRGVGLALVENLSLVGLTSATLQQSLLGCSNGPVQWTEHPYSPTIVFACVAEILTQITKHMDNWSIREFVLLCTGIQDTFGPGPAMRCLIEVSGSGGSEKVESIFSLAGPLGAEARMHLDEERTRLREERDRKAKQLESSLRK